MIAACGYFDAGPDGLVWSDGHDAQEALYFFVPVAGTDAAVRVPVCALHSALLERLYATTEAEQS